MSTVTEVLANEELIAAALGALDEEREHMQVWRADQLLAAAKHAGGLLPQLSDGDGQFLHGIVDEKTSARLIVLFMAAIEQRGVAPCPHASQIRPLSLLLPVHAMACDECSPALVSNLPAVLDDGICDFCQGPTAVFHFRVLRAGHLRMTGYFCEECTAGLSLLLVS